MLVLKFVVDEFGGRHSSFQSSIGEDSFPYCSKWEGPGMLGNNKSRPRDKTGDKCEDKHQLSQIRSAETTLFDNLFE